MRPSTASLGVTAFMAPSFYHIAGLVFHRTARRLGDAQVTDLHNLCTL
jgi:hypothetical protein